MYNNGVLIKLKACLWKTYCVKIQLHTVKYKRIKIQFIILESLLFKIKDKDMHVIN